MLIDVIQSKIILAKLILTIAAIRIGILTALTVAIDFVLKPLCNVLFPEKGHISNAGWEQENNSVQGKTL